MSGEAEVNHKNNLDIIIRNIDTYTSPYVRGVRLERYITYSFEDVTVVDTAYYK